MKKAKIGIIGAGNMGSAFYKGLIKIFLPHDIWLSDTDKSKLAAFREANTTSDPNKVIEACDVLIVAVKPQSFDDLAKLLSVSLGDKMIISIMAGVSLATIFSKTGCRSIVRAMPNLAAQAGQAFTGWIASGEISSEEKKLIAKIFEAIGTEQEFTEEKLLDAVVALSGSGPAYFFYLAELLEKSAKSYGFSAEIAATIAKQTFFGAAAFLQNSSLTSSKARQAVTSKGGTTEAALKYLQEHQFDAIFIQAIEQAKKRSEELNN